MHGTMNVKFILNVFILRQVLDLNDNIHYYGTKENRHT